MDILHMAYLCLYIWSSHISVRAEGKRSSMETKKALLDKLFEGRYHSSFRPVINETDPIVVTMVYSPEQIVGLDEIHQVLTTAAALHITWRDEYLQWNTSEFEDIYILRLPSKKIWTPPIVLLNSADKGHFMVDTIVSVFNDGSVLWYTTVTLNTFCGLDFFFFPVDKQTCTQRFGLNVPAGIVGMEYLTLQVDEQQSIPNVDSFDSRDWGLTRMRSFLQEEVNFFGPEFIVVGELQIYRKSFFYMMNFAIPCALIFLLTLFGFLLPPDSGEKVGLSVTIILLCNAMTFMMPEAASGVSMIALVNILTMVLVAAFTGMNVIVLRYWHRGVEGPGVPNWMKRVVLHHMAKLLCMRREPQEISILKKGCETFIAGFGLFVGKSGFQRRSSTTAPNEDNCEHLLENETFELQKSAFWKLSVDRDSKSIPELRETGKNELSTAICEKRLREISENLQYLVERSVDDEKDDKKGKEWKKVAMVLNRFFLCAYILLCVIELLYLFVELAAFRNLED
ncbi:neuronal acetylcholine receptor subunit alpha-9-like [Glandiceps talaboti]